MKLLLDECVVHDLKHDLVGHEVSTVVEAGLGGLENGELLKVASGNYDAFITVDRNLAFQQNISLLHIAVLILKSTGITYADLRPLVSQVLLTLPTVERGKLYYIGKEKT